MLPFTAVDKPLDGSLIIIMRHLLTRRTAIQRMSLK